MSWDFTFTVFTAAYNRPDTLARTYASLCAQSFRDFEWLIVDDGSPTDLRPLVESWQAEAGFPVRYLRQENQGKHAAHNRAVEAARGRFFLPLDDDDTCLPYALERLYYHWNTIPFSEQESFSAVTGLCIDQDGKLVGDRFPQDVLDSNTLEVHYRYRVRGEKWGFQRTDVLRRYPFPVLPGSSGYMPESVVWSQIARAYRTRYVNEVLRVFYQSRESVSAQARWNPDKMRRNAPGLIYHNRLILDDQIDYLRETPATFLRAAVHYTRFSLHDGRSLTQQARDLTHWRARGLWLAALPLGAALYVRDRRRQPGAPQPETRGTAVNNTVQQAFQNEVDRSERFAFGENWRNFLSVLDDDRIAEAERSLQKSLGLARLDGLRLLDAGSGSGLFSLAARRLGASVHSFDYDTSSVGCTQELRRRYFPDDPDWMVEQASVLDQDYLASLGQFDIVYSWGVLHHTGAMWQALANVAPLVKPGGSLFISLYNDQGSTSRLWRRLKRTYNQLPPRLRPAYTLAVMGPREARSFLISILRGHPGKYVDSWRNYKNSRGMSKWHDIVDWIGGYPFEVAKPEQVLDFYRTRGFNLVGLTTAGGGLGCNEYVFRLEAGGGAGQDGETAADA